MTKHPYTLSNSTYKTVREIDYQVAVLPWGATEAHNYHLPYGTDNIECDLIAAEAARIASLEGSRVIVLPTVPFGVNTGQLDIPLTINMNPGTQLAVLRDVIGSLEHHSVRKLVILNGHGGNDFKQMIRELAPATRLLLCSINWYTCVDPKQFFDEPGDHAGEVETSIMLHIAPELLLPLADAGRGAERKMKIRAFRERWAWTPRDWMKASSDTGIGNPAAATAEKGKRYFAAVTERIAEFLVELAAADTNDLYE